MKRFLCQIYVQRTFKEWKKMVTTKQQKKTSCPLRAGFGPTRENP